MIDGVSAVPVEARAYQGRRAGLVTRMIASTIDGTVVVLFLAGCYAVWAGLLFLLNPRSFSFPDASLLGSLTAAFCVLVIYFTGAWATTGRTYGDLVMGLRVVNYKGGRLNPVTAFIRALGCAIFPIGLFWCAANRGHRSVQDTVLRTSVIYDWSHASWRAAGLG